jgi:hypothetical protein
LVTPAGPSIDSAEAEQITSSEPVEQRQEVRAVQEYQLQTTYTDNEHDAARKIQNAYRRFYHRRTAQASDHALDKYYKEYLAASKSLRCSPRYRCLFLGFLPHLMVCLEAFRAAQAKQKAELSKLTLRVEHTQLEDAMAKLDILR